MNEGVKKKGVFQIEFYISRSLEEIIQDFLTVVLTHFIICG